MTLHKPHQMTPPTTELTLVFMLKAAKQLQPTSIAVSSFHAQGHMTTKLGVPTTVL